MEKKGSGLLDLDRKVRDERSYLGRLLRLYSVFNQWVDMMSECRAQVVTSRREISWSCPGGFDS